jgi:hypothetical protein
MFCRRRRTGGSDPNLIVDELITSAQYADQSAFLASHWGVDMDQYYRDQVAAGMLTYVLTADGLTMTIDPAYSYHNDFISVQKAVPAYSGPFHARMRARMTRIPPVGDPDEGYDHEDPLLEIDIINTAIDLNGFYEQTIRSAHFGVPLKFAAVNYDPAGASTVTYGSDVPELSGARADYVVLVEPDGSGNTRVRHFYGPVGGALVKVLDLVEAWVIPVNLIRWSGIASKGTGHTTIESVSFYQGPAAANPFGVTLS